MKTLIIGNGDVGNAYAEVLHANGWKSEFFDPRKEKMALTEKLPDCNALSIAISTKDGGIAERGYIIASCQAGVPVVTCAKGAHAYWFDDLKPHLRIIRCTASVGGASRMLSLVAHARPHKIKAMVAVPNGTLNFFFHAVQEEGLDAEAALSMARELKFCEPGSMGAASMVNGESDDALKKACSLFNHMGGGTISPDDFSRFDLCEDGLAMHLKSTRPVRFIVRISQEPDCPFAFEAFHLRKHGWSVIGSFVKDAEAKFPEMMVPGEWNRLVIESEDRGRLETSGIGAGLRPTAETMFEDLVALTK